MNTSKLTIIHNINPEDRRIIHKYLDTKAHKTSVRLKKLSAIQKSCTVKCPHCKSKSDFIIDDYEIQYHNNVLVYVKLCNRCNKRMVISKSDLNIVYSNNCILVGDILQGYCREKTEITEIISEEDFLNALLRSKITEVDNPEDDCLHKHRIIKYCNSKV